MINSVRGGMTPFIRQLPKWARPQGSACFNSKLSHFVNQRSTRQSKPIGRSVLPSDQPVGLLQCFQDMLPIGVGKRAWNDLRVLLHRPLQVERQTQHRAGRKEHRTLDEILQFANIAWPVVRFEDRYHFIGN